MISKWENKENLKGVERWGHGQNIDNYFSFKITLASIRGGKRPILIDNDHSLQYSKTQERKEIDTIAIKDSKVRVLTKILYIFQQKNNFLLPKINIE